MTDKERIDLALRIVREVCIYELPADSAKGAGYAMAVALECVLASEGDDNG